MDDQECMHGLDVRWCISCRPAKGGEGGQERSGQRRRGEKRPGVGSGRKGVELDGTFGVAVDVARRLVVQLAKDGVLDARAIVSRQAGTNNLQGHAHALIPLSVWFLRYHPEELSRLRARTRLEFEMGRGSEESKDRGLWDPIVEKLELLLERSGDEVLTEPLRGGDRMTARDVANYLPVSLGGSQTTGGGGGTVFKRCCKLIAHCGTHASTDTG